MAIRSNICVNTSKITIAQIMVIKTDPDGETRKMSVNGRFLKQFTDKLRKVLCREAVEGQMKDFSNGENANAEDGVGLWLAWASGGCGAERARDIGDTECVVLSRVL